MSSLNKVQLIGNVGNDPEIRAMPNGEVVANFSVATTSAWKDKNGEKHEKTEWHNVVFYRRMAEVAEEFVKKGRSIYIEGHLATSKWTDKDGVDRSKTNVVGDNLILLGKKDDGQQGGSRPKSGGRSTSKARPGGGKSSYSQQRSPAQRTGTGFDDMPDDCPWPEDESGFR